VSYYLREGLQEQTISRDTVHRIRFGDTPPSFTAGTELLRKGDFEAAIKAFKEARTDPNVRTWWASVWCQLHMAEAYVQWSEQTKDPARGREAVSIVTSVLKEYPDNFFKPDFRVLQIQALLAASDPTKAAEEADRFEQEVSGWADKTWYMTAKRLGAEALVDAKRYPEAISKLDTLVTFANQNGLQDWVAEAQIQKAETILLQGDKDRAMRAFQEIVGKIDDAWSHRAAAAAYIGLGQVLLEHFNDADQARDKLLTARVLYFGTEKKDQEVMAKAAYWLGRASEALGAKIDAKRYYMEITDQYKTTSWVNRARERLKDLGG
jgi:tetratricopeptide (TPR) repeat protein